MDPKLRFEDVKDCKTVAELNEFIRKYLDERQLQGVEIFPIPIKSKIRRVITGACLDESHVCIDLGFCVPSWNGLLHQC